MAKIGEILKFVNDTLMTGSLSDGRFSGSYFGGLATYMPNDDTIQVVEVDNKGFTVKDSLFYDQTYPMLSYHRLNSSKFRPSPNDGFGNEVGAVRVMDMSMLVFIDKGRIHLSGEDMEVLFYKGFPPKIPKAQLTEGFTDCTFAFLGCEHNPVYLFEREFNMKKYNLLPSVVLMEVKYLIECGYQKNCINILCCPD